MVQHHQAASGRTHEHLRGHDLSTRPMEVMQDIDKMIHKSPYCWYITFIYTVYIYIYIILYTWLEFTLEIHRKKALKGGSIRATLTSKNSLFSGHLFHSCIFLWTAPAVTPTVSIKLALESGAETCVDTPMVSMKCNQSQGSGMDSQDSWVKQSNTTGWAFEESGCNLDKQSWYPLTFVSLSLIFLAKQQFP